MNKKLGKAPQKSNTKVHKDTVHGKGDVPSKGHSNLNNKMGISKLKDVPNLIGKGGFNKADKAGAPNEKIKDDTLIIKRRTGIASNFKEFTQFDVTPKYFGYQGIDKATDYIEIYYPKEKSYIKMRMKSPFSGDFIIHDHYLYVFGNFLIRLGINSYCSEAIILNKTITKHMAGLCTDSNGMIYYLCGLSNKNDDEGKHCEKYSAATDTWSNLPSNEESGKSSCICSKRYVYLWQLETKNLYKLPLHNCETATWEKIKVTYKIDGYHYQIKFINPGRLLIIGGDCGTKSMQLCYYNEETNHSGKLESAKRDYWANYLMKENNGINLWNAYENHGYKKWAYGYLPHEQDSKDPKQNIHDLWIKVVGDYFN